MTEHWPKNLHAFRDAYEHNLRSCDYLLSAPSAHDCWCGLGKYTDPTHTHACRRGPGPVEKPPVYVHVDDYLYERTEQGLVLATDPREGGGT